MSTMQTTGTSTESDWGLILLQGIAAFIIGLFLVAAPAAASVVVVAFVGIYWLISGILSIVRIFTGANRAHWFWALVVGIIGIAAGLIVLRHPLYSAVLLPALLVAVLGIFGLIMGFVNIIRAFAGDGVGVGLIGVIDIILGLVLLSTPVVAGAEVWLPIAAGIFAIIGGASLIIVSFTLRGPRGGAEVEEERRAA